MKADGKGLMRDDKGYIGVALGSYFGEIGSKFIITLDSGIVLKLVKVEHKDDRHTTNGIYQKWDKSIIEFVIDEDVSEVVIGRSGNGYIMSGNFNNSEFFEGEIIEIIKVENVG